MLAGGFIRDFGKLADKFLEHQTHLVVVDLVRMQIDLSEFFGDLIEQTGFMQALDLVVEVEAFENVPHLDRKALDIGKQVFLDVVLIAHQLFDV